ncbi:hypothetical protein EJ07DRAFT_185329 [Lizonia empirigonia]|nr:hypothetical protein EJ07DRAFT_185329 [Lizonia empirigonia]
MTPNSRKLNDWQETDLINHIERLTAHHLPPTRAMVRNFASAVTSTPCSDKWVTRFLRRHRNRLTSQWVTGMDSNRHNAESGYKYESYFKLLQQKITEYDLKPEHTYNMDEEGFAVRVLGRTKRIFSRRLYEKKQVRQAREPEEYQGGAVFWSPKKVKKACDRQQLQEREEEQVQHQKAETNRLREEARQVKAREKEMRRQARAAARLVREKEKAKKAAEQASRAAVRRTAKRLQQALKTSQKGKKRSLKAPTRATTKKRAVVRPAGGGEPQVAVAGAPATQSRRGRAIKTPTQNL